MISANTLMLVVALAAATTSVHANSIQVQVNSDGVIALNKTNFEEITKAMRYLLVKFHAPWCDKSTAFREEFGSLSRMLGAERSHVKVAQLDCHHNPEPCQKLRLRDTDYPAIKLLVDERPLNYRGPMKAPKIARWAKRWASPPHVNVESVQDLTNLRDGEECVALGLFRDLNGAEAEHFRQVATTMNTTRFGITANKRLFDEMGVKSAAAVVLLKTFDELKNVLEGPFDRQELLDFIHANQWPLAIPHSKNMHERYDMNEVPLNVFLFVSKLAIRFQPVLNEFKHASSRYRGRALFFYIDIETAGTELKFFDVSRMEAPCLRLMSKDQVQVKYMPESEEVTANAVVQFVEDFKSGKLQPIFLSEKVPFNWDHRPLKVLVGSSFEKIAFDKTKTVLVGFYVPESWCEPCMYANAYLDHIAKTFKNRTEYVVATMNPMGNQVASITITRMPSFMVFPKSSDKIIDYKGNFSVDALSRFLESHGEWDGSEPKVEETQIDELKVSNVENTESREDL